MSDEFARFSQSPATPSENAYPAVPHDVEPLPAAAKYLYVGIGGNVALRTIDAGTDVVFENVAAGSYIYARASHVRATGTTAGSIVVCA